MSDSRKDITGLNGGKAPLAERLLFGNRVLSHAKDPDAGVTGTFFLRSNFVAFSVAGLGVASAGLVEAFRRGRPLLAAGSAMSVVILSVAVVLSESRAGLGAAALAITAGICLSLRSVRLRLDRMRPGFVYEIHAPHLRSPDGDPVLHPDAYYTLNVVPAE